MKKNAVTLKDVQGVYDGPEGLLWELVMGEQIHVGGFQSSMALAKAAGIKAGQRGLDLCCCLGAGMRFLAKNFDVTMCGVDATDTMVSKGRKRIEDEGLADKLELKRGDVTSLPYDNGEFDFVWGEDAWCYVVDKGKLVEEATRVLRKGGTIAFTDWTEGPEGLSDEEAARINAFMKFPYMENLKGYRELLEARGITVKVADDLTEEFAAYCDLYIRMLGEQLTYDALRIIGDDQKMFEGLAGEMDYMRQRAHEGKMGRVRFVGVKE